LTPAVLKAKAYQYLHEDHDFHIPDMGHIC